jgi:hypothetical protein
MTEEQIRHRKEDIQRASIELKYAMINNYDPDEAIEKLINTIRNISFDEIVWDVLMPLSKSYDEYYAQVMFIGEEARNKAKAKKDVMIDVFNGIINQRGVK